jgi:RNA polymerase-binding transcription factor DksA
VLRNLQAQLGEVEHALTKFDDGTYGICERCGRPIPLARLRVLPEARYDLEEEQRVEATGTPR